MRGPENGDQRAHQEDQDMANENPELFVPVRVV
jgi:hypothetical protein